MFSAGLRIDSLPRDGIRPVAPVDVAQWRAGGLAPRLVGFVEHDGAGFRADVELRLYRGDHPFALLHGSMKGLCAVTEEMWTV
ncbi:hypothetical protein GCM10027449_01510 [Sinomonas notoginsengisoli]|uniref:hypothetical protein n=1 Tax=Sinomonas notoginsengisoli TaxID=1457311 RepID=UPI001F2DD77D|nr:hypothetical protein [Sinomonas notoginsengisoli]